MSDIMKVSLTENPKFNEAEKAIDTTIAYNPDKGFIVFKSKEEKDYAISYLIKKEKYLIWDYTEKGKYAIQYKKE